MKTLLNKTLSLLLVLVLTLGLTVPALAAPVEGITLDQTSLTLSPGSKVTLTATVTPEDAEKKTVTWNSLKPTVAKVSRTGEVTAVAEGTTTITATADGLMATCTVTVKEDWATGVILAPAGPERLPVGTTRQLAAAVTYALGTGTQGVTWSSTNPAVATVSDDGLVTAVAEGEASIVAQSESLGQNGSPLSAIYQLTVTPAEPDSSLDTFTMSTGDPNIRAGLYQTITIPAPEVKIQNGDNNVTPLYTITYTWTDGSGTVLSTQPSALVTPVTTEDMTISCAVTATRTNDSTKVLSGTCSFFLTVLSSTTLGAAIDTTQGPTPFDGLADISGQTLLDQLTKGGEDPTMTPAIPGLTHLVFDLNSATGTQAGSLNATAETHYNLTEDAAAEGLVTAPLSQLVFTPKGEGTYAIAFTAYGEETYQGLLEVVVTTPPPPQASSLRCDSAGFTFTGSDFFQGGDPDPVVSMVFGPPSAGQLMRNFVKGAGGPDLGYRYYTDSAEDGDYHVSTLSYLPSVGDSGQASIPVTLTTRSGATREQTILVDVVSKTSSEQFADVVPDTVGNWAANSVDFAYGRGLMSGVEADRFSPNSPMTRAQLVTVLYRAAGSPDAAVTTSFTDLEEGSYYYDAVVWANFRGIVNGTSPGSFSPNSPVTRQQIAAILHRYAQAMGTDSTVMGSLDGYTDKSAVEPYAVGPMTWAVTQGIITGTSDTTLSPLNQATRAQVVVMLHRYLVD